MNNRFRYSALPLIVLGLTGCLGSDSKNGESTNSESVDVFPLGLAVSSPTARSTTSPRVMPTSTESAAGSQYAWAANRISAIFNGTLAIKDGFDANMFLQKSNNANCYGPTMSFANHPDTHSGDPNYSGQLPSGDLGIWVETDIASGHACAAAELNAQLQGVSSRGIMGLIALAGMVAVANKNGVTLPTAGTSVDLVSYMNAAGLVNVNFTTAILARDVGGASWRYTLEFTYTSPGPSGKAHDIALLLSHTPGATEETYAGMLTYRISDEFMGGNCQGTGNDVTYNGTLYYSRAATTELVLNSREGGYCGKNTVADTVVDNGVSTSAMLLDPADGFNPSNTNGWANNFSVLAAKFNPATQAGDYVYAWQAGGGDSHTRTFQVHIASGGTLGDAYFGYGAPMNTTDGKILGMICNWAGPGGQHIPLAYAQRQSIAFNSTNGKFEVGASGSDITYAPTNSCYYEAGGSFWYDRNLDAAQNAGDVIGVYATMTPPTGELSLDLMPKGSAATVQDAINNNGFILPPY